MKATSAGGEGKQGARLQTGAKMQGLYTMCTEEVHKDMHKTANRASNTQGYKIDARALQKKVIDCRKIGLALTML